MVQIIKNPYSEIGKNLGTGLAALAQNKLQELQQRQAAQGLQALSQTQNQQLTPEQAYSIAQLDPRLMQEYVKGIVNPKQPLVSQQIGGKSYKDYLKSAAQESASATEGLQFVNRLRELNKEGKLNANWFGKSPEAKQFEGELAALESFSKVNPRVKKLSQRLKHNAKPEEIETELNAIEREFKNKNYRDQAIKDILKVTGGNIPNDFEDAVANRIQELQQQTLQGPKADISQEEQLAENPQHNALLGGLQEAGRVGAGLVAKGVQGLGEGLTGLAAAPFNIANLVSAGNIPVPEVIRSLQQLPEQTVKAATGELTTPKSDIEAAAGETIADIASFLSPGALLGSAGKAANLLGKGSKWVDAASKFLKIPVKTAAATAGLANTAKFLTKQVGGGEKEQMAAKLGTMLAVPILGPRFMANEAQKLSQQAVSQLPQGADVVSPTLFGRLGNLYNKVQKLPESDASKALLAQIEKIPTARFPVNELINLEQQLQTTSPQLGKSVTNLVPEITKDIHNALISAGKKYPAFGKLYEQSRDLSNALNQSNKVLDFMINNPKFGAIRNPWATLGFSYLGLKKYPTIAAIAGTAIPAGEIERLGQMIYKSPAFRDAANHWINAAIQGNVKAANELSKRLDKLSKKE